MLVIVTGSQAWAEPSRLWFVLDRLHALAGTERLTLVHGKAPKGADRFTVRWVELRQRDCPTIEEKPYPAHWALFGRAAGIHRNQQMWSENWHRADLCVGFRWPGRSPGTDDCMARARKHGCPVWQIPPHPEPIPPLPTFRLNP